jgi:RNA polymerase sigma-70 factor (ECF subfamily)
MDSREARLSDLYLECVRSARRHASCEKFFQLFTPIMSRVAYRVASQFDAKTEIDDLIQEISLKLMNKDRLGNLALPPEPGLEAAYFSVVAANIARDFFRMRGASKRGRARTVSLDESLDSITMGRSTDSDRTVLLREIEERLPEDRKSKTIFRLYYRQGFSAKEIAAIPGVELSVKGVESLLHRVIAQLRQAMLGPPAEKKPGGKAEPSAFKEGEDQI